MQQFSELTAIVQIVPKLPPVIDGVGDYALNLAQQLYKDFGIRTHFIIGDSTWTGGAVIEGLPVSQVAECSATALLASLSNLCPTVVLLHYVGYGYAKRGCPFWLVEGLERWRNGGGRLLVTMFHELYASGPPWTSSFWLSPLQRNLAVRLANLSDRCLTSRQGYAKSLHQLSRGKQTQIPALPVFSNIGEPEQVLPLAERTRRLVVFGGRSNRLRVYQESLAALELACRLLEVEEICDIGPPTGLSLSLNTPVMEMGQRCATEIKAILSDSIAGFLDYNPDYLAKSTIFAAYCAHRLLPISSQSQAMPIDGVEAGKQYWTVDEQTTGSKDLVELQAIADNAYNWYQNHALSVQAKIFFTHLGGRV